MSDFSSVWLNTLKDLMGRGQDVSPRGMLTKEIPQRTIEVDMRRPVLRVLKRQLSYKFMAAEAYWILTGDYRVRTIAPYNVNISKFSDDGETFFGAYGPKIATQIDYVVDKLIEDPFSRQAGLTIWRENPPPSKDIPCTVAIFFSVREGKLGVHVFMRSSDAWLGIPYDVFTFSMLGHLVCGMLSRRHMVIEPGTLHLTAASSHLYETNFEAALACIERGVVENQAETPSHLWENGTAPLINTLLKLRDEGPGSEWRWWEQP